MSGRNSAPFRWVAASKGVEERVMSAAAWRHPSLSRDIVVVPPLYHDPQHIDRRSVLSLRESATMPNLSTVEKCWKRSEGEGKGSVASLAPRVPPTDTTCCCSPSQLLHPPPPLTNALPSMLSGLKKLASNPPKQSTILIGGTWITCIYKKTYVAITIMDYTWRVQTLMIQDYCKGYFAYFALHEEQASWSCILILCECVCVCVCVSPTRPNRVRVWTGYRVSLLCVLSLKPELCVTLWL